MKSIFASLSMLALLATGCSTFSSGKCPLDIRGQSPEAACESGACNGANCQAGQCYGAHGYGAHGYGAHGYGHGQCPHGCPQGHCPHGYCPQYGGGFGGGLGHLNPFRNGLAAGIQTPNHYHWYQYDEPKNLVYPQANTPAAIVQYPYYTLKGPECFFMK